MPGRQESGDVTSSRRAADPELLEEKEAERQDLPREGAEGGCLRETGRLLLLLLLLQQPPVAVPALLFTKPAGQLGGGGDMTWTLFIS